MTSIALTDDRPDLASLLREHWRAGVAVLVMLGLFIAAATGLAVRDPSADAAYAQQLQSPAVREELRRATAATTATQLRRVTVQDALQINAAIPVANVVNPAARPFLMAGASDAERLRALDCLTAAIY